MDLARSRPGGVGVRVELRQIAVAGKRRLSGEREVEDASQGIDVDAVVAPPSLDLLRGDVVHASEKLPGARQRAAATGDPADSEVREEDVLPLDQDVAGLHIAV